MFNYLFSQRKSSVGNRLEKRLRPAQSSFRPCMEILEDRLTPALPTVTNPTMTGITPYVAILGGNVTSDGGSPLNFRGIVYSLTSVNSNPTRGGTGVAELDLQGTPVTGVFTANITPSPRTLVTPSGLLLPTPRAQRTALSPPPPSPRRHPTS